MLLQIFDIIQSDKALELTFADVIQGTPNESGNLSARNLNWFIQSLNDSNQALLELFCHSQQVSKQHLGT